MFVHNRPHGYPFIARPWYSVVGTHDTNAFLFYIKFTFTEIYLIQIQMRWRDTVSLTSAKWLNHRLNLFLWFFFEGSSNFRSSDFGRIYELPYWQFDGSIIMDTELKTRSTENLLNTTSVTLQNLHCWPSTQSIFLLVNHS